MTIKLKNVIKSGGLTNFRTGSVINPNVNLAPLWVTPSGQLLALEQTSTLNTSVAASTTNQTPIKYSITDGQLPDNTSLDENTGIISGTLLSYDSDRTFTFTVTASSVLQTSRVFTIVVKSSSPKWSSITSMAKNAVFYTIFARSDGSTTYQTSLNKGPGPSFVAIDPNNDTLTYSVVSGSLPPSLILTQSGILIGSIDPVLIDSIFTFTVRATNSHGFHVDLPTSIQILTDQNVDPIWLEPQVGLQTINLGTFSIGTGYTPWTPINLLAEGWPVNVPVETRQMGYSDPTNSLGELYGFRKDSADPIYFMISQVDPLTSVLTTSNGMVPPLKPGTYNITLTANNFYGGFKDQQFTFTLTA